MLTEAMRRLVMEAEDGKPLPRGNIRAALMRRELVHNMVHPETALRGCLTPAGIVVRDKLRQQSDELPGSITDHVWRAYGKGLRACGFSGCGEPPEKHARRVKGRST